MKKVAAAVIRQLTVLRQQVARGYWADVGELDHLLANGPLHLVECVEIDITELARYLPGDEMAKQTQKKSVQWRGFKDVRLSDAQRDAYEHWDAEDGDVYLLLASAVASGFKFTMSYNGSNDTYTATLTGQDTAPAAAQGYSLSAFAPDFYNACRTLAYKHDLILEGDWSKIEVSASERWG